MSASSYLDVDETVDMGEQPTEDDIIGLVSHTDVEEEDSEDDDDSEVPPENVPTVKQAKEAARILQNYFDSKSDGDCSWTVAKLLNKLDINAAKNVSQTSLLNYFSFST